ncbi:vacuolar cation/proton exchanger 3-like [Bidens hawaiensis]|uniref:vacuolar cation/proton exchanger 3-like n=1 Tax=Bidens hawaiensis TaxID=980011 RepID=UPI004049D8D0
MAKANNLQMVGLSSSMANFNTHLEGNPVIEPHDEGHSALESTERNTLSVKSVSENWCKNNAVMTSIKIALFSDNICVLLTFGPLAILVYYQTSSHHGWVFFLSLLGIIPLVKRLGWATEQLAFYVGPTGGELLNTFRNVTELIISICAMKHGILRVVQQSLLGSILSDMLLVLGCAFFCGGIALYPYKQRFNKLNAVMSSGLLLMAVMGLLFPTVLHFTHTESHFGTSELAISRFISCGYNFFQLTSKNSYTLINEETDSDDKGSDDEKSAEISKYESVIWLSNFTLLILIQSEYLVDTIEGASVAMNVQIEFISVILLPVVGKVEHVNAIIFAVKDKLDISLGVAIGSSTQISMFLIPFCVVVGWIIGRPLDLNFQLFETAALFMTVLVVAFMLQDGTANYFKGLMLIFCYLIVGASFFVHVDPEAIKDKP